MQNPLTTSQLLKSQSQLLRPKSAIVKQQPKQQSMSQDTGQFRLETLPETDPDGFPVSESEFNDIEQQNENDAPPPPQFTGLVLAISQIGTVQQHLAISSIYQLDLTLKLRQIFSNAGGLVFAVQALKSVFASKLSVDERISLYKQSQQAISHQDASQLLVILISMVDRLRDYRQIVLQEDGIRIALSLAKFNFKPEPPLLRAHSIRLLAVLAKDTRARLFMKRIGAIPMLLKIMRETQDSEVLCALVMLFNRLFHSSRCREVFFQNQFVSQIINILKQLWRPIKPDFMVYSATSALLQPAQLSCFLYEQLVALTTQATQYTEGRLQLIRCGGIQHVCELLRTNHSSKLSNSAVQTVANCAQSGELQMKSANGLQNLVVLLKDGMYEARKAICETIIRVCTKKTDKLLENYNEEAIANLVSYGAVKELAQLVACDYQALLQGCSDRALQKERIEKRTICLLSTQAISVLLRMECGRADAEKIVIAQKQFAVILADHLMTTDPELLKVTLDCFKLVISPQSPSFLNALDKQDGIERIIGLINSRDQEIAIKAADTMSQVFLNRQFVRKTALKLQNSLQQLNEVLQHSCDEIAAWILGIIAGLSVDQQTARVFSEFCVCLTALKMLEEASHRELTGKVQSSKDFYIQQLVRTNACLAISRLARVEDSGSALAESNCAQLLVDCIRDSTGHRYYEQVERPAMCLIKTPDEYGSLITFKTPTRPPKDNILRLFSPQNPYYVSTKAAVLAAEALSCSRKGAIELRRKGAHVALLAVCGYDDDETSRAAANALRGIRAAHVTGMKVMKERIKIEAVVEDQKLIQAVKFVLTNEQKDEVHDGIHRDQDVEDDTTFLMRSRKREKEQSVFEPVSNLYGIVECNKPILRQNKTKEDDV